LAVTARANVSSCVRKPLARAIGRSFFGSTASHVLRSCHGLASPFLAAHLQSHLMLISLSSFVCVAHIVVQPSLPCCLWCCCLEPWRLRQPQRCRWKCQAPPSHPPPKILRQFKQPRLSIATAAPGLPLHAVVTALSQPTVMPSVRSCPSAYQRSKRRLLNAKIFRT
jgi:hypothetical protein